MPTWPVAHPMRTPTTPGGYLLARQTGEAPSNARAGALVPIVTDAIQMPTAAAGRPATGRDRALRCTAFCTALVCAAVPTTRNPMPPVLTRAHPSPGAGADPRP
jgi:hypothetical protein